MTKFAYPNPKTQTPVRRETWVSFNLNSAAKRGNIGAIDKADSTVMKVYMN